MAYKVIITLPAKRRLDSYIGYTAVELSNLQAARSIYDDAKQTKKRLSEIADTIKFCENPVLAKYGYRKIKFLKHNFVMIYRIDKNNVIVDGMYHGLQDYEAMFADKMGLS